jgi:hypothetical protein
MAHFAMKGQKGYPYMNKIGRYWPLFALILVAAAGAAALTQKGVFDWMHTFMGFFLCQFAMLKLFHPSGFCRRLPNV